MTPAQEFRFAYLERRIQLLREMKRLQAERAALPALLRKQAE